MKFKCPYCGKASDWGGKNACPECGKAAVKPGFYKPSKKMAPRRKRDFGIPSPWMLNTGLTNVFAAWSRLPRWLIWVGGICIIGAYFYSPRNTDIINSESSRIARRAISVLYVALDIFYDDCGRYPSPSEGLESLVSGEGIQGWKGPYILRLMPDPWKTPYIYSGSSGGRPSVFSCGPDGKPGNGDDISEGGEPFGDERPAEGVNVNIATKDALAPAPPAVNTPASAPDKTSGGPADGER